MKSGWSRKSYVTQGSDPTVVVEWSNGDLRITEFQQVYNIEFLHATCPDLLETIITLLGTQLHEALESDYDRDQELETENYPQNFNDGIYGGE
jgi:hypothetical protein